MCSQRFIASPVDTDVEFTLHALRQNHLANSIQVVDDGQEALDYLFAR
jgi:hypothetical protein